MLKVNGQDHTWHQGLNVSLLLKEKKYIFPMIIVKVNDRFIPKAEYNNTVINDGDDIQAIHLISGG